MSRKKNEDIQGKAIGLADHIEYANKSVVSQTLLTKKAGTLTLFSFDKGQGLSEHTAPYDATILVLDGTAMLTIGGKAVRVRAGELCIMPAGVPHAVKAKERFKMLLIMIRS